MIITPNTCTAVVRQEGNKVHLVINGKLYELPWQAAESIGKGLIAKARLAEEIDKADKIIADNALLTRVGFPLGLSNNPKIVDETKKEAVHNKFLRKAIPKPIASMEVVPCPTITSQPLKVK